MGYDDRHEHAKNQMADGGDRGGHGEQQQSGNADDAAAHLIPKSGDADRRSQLDPPPQGDREWAGAATRWQVEQSPEVVVVHRCVTRLGGAAMIRPLPLHFGQR